MAAARRTGGVALVVTHGPGRHRRALRRLAAHSTLVIAADGGARLARQAGVRPDLVVGDLDSLDRITSRWLAAQGVPRRVLPQAKDMTDGEVAVREAVRRGAAEVAIFSPAGGRLDQLLANVFLLRTARALGVRARLYDGRAVAWLVDGATEVAGRPGEVVSLIPLTPQVDGVRLRGLRWSLRGATLRAGTTRALSNELVAPPARVAVRRGELLVVHFPRASGCLAPGARCYNSPYHARPARPRHRP